MSTGCPSKPGVWWGQGRKAGDRIFLPGTTFASPATASNVHHVSSSSTKEVLLSFRCPVFPYSLPMSMWFLQVVRFCHLQIAGHKSFSPPLWSLPDFQGSITQCSNVMTERKRGHVGKEGIWAAGWTWDASSPTEPLSACPFCCYCFNHFVSWLVL